MLGQVVGSYRIVAELGKGGMGVVYRAEHVQLGRTAALKMLQPQFTHDDGIVQRFFNEARAASAIAHPGIVEIFDYGVHTDGRAYIVMALLVGETLGERMQRGWLAVREVVEISVQVASALAAAHAAGIVHRDLKPDNIILAPGHVKLLDFGIAKLVDRDPTGFRTETGFVIGTPLYMSPEQCMGAPGLDHRADLYSLGCILYHALAGRPPFEAALAGGLLAAHLRDPAPDPRVFVSTIPDELVAIVARLLAKDPAARFQSALELRDALAACCATGLVVPTALSLPQIARPATTATGAAAQLVSPAAPSRPARHHAWIVAVLLLVVAGAGVFATVSSERDTMLAAAAPVERSFSSLEEPVPPPQSVPAPPPPRREREHKPRSISTAARPRLALDARAYAPGARIAIAFPALVISTPSDRAWVAIAEVGGPAPGPDAWRLVENGARRMTLLAPAQPGAYEVRLYASRSLAVQHAVRFDVTN